MKATYMLAAVLVLSTCGAHAQTDKPQMKPESAPGAAEQGAADAGIAKDPGEVKNQQGGSSEASPGTVGAAPGANTKSQGR